MKNKILNLFTLLIGMLLFSSCTVNSSIKKNISDKDKFLNDFFNSEKTINNLNKYMDEKVIYIYDKGKLLTNNSLTYNVDEYSVIISNVLPSPNKTYFEIHNFILNPDLAFIVFSTDNKRKGIVFYLLKDKEDNKWYIMNIEHRNSK